VFCSGCKDDGALYKVAMLAMRPDLNLESATNISHVSLPWVKVKLS